MVYELKEIDCVELAYAAHLLFDYNLDKQKEIKDVVSYEHEDIIEVYKTQLESITEARKGLLKVANRCGCNIDIKTGMIK